MSDDTRHLCPHCGQSFRESEEVITRVGGYRPPEPSSPEPVAAGSRPATKSDLVRAALAKYPTGEALPWGEQARLARRLDVSPERVSQIADEMGFPRRRDGRRSA